MNGLFGQATNVTHRKLPGLSRMQMKHNSTQSTSAHSGRHSHRERRLRWKRLRKTAIRLGILAFVVLVFATLAYVLMANSN